MVVSQIDNKVFESAEYGVVIVNTKRELAEMQVKRTKAECPSFVGKGESQRCWRR